MDIHHDVQFVGCTHQRESPPSKGGGFSCGIILLMNYELAKELKEAGFPKAAFKVPEIDPARPESKEVWGLPTLEELISAIPIPDEDVGFISISLIRGEWYAGYEKYEVFDPECSGATPLEAVAKLWLTLQQKSV